MFGFYSYNICVSFDTESCVLWMAIVVVVCSNGSLLCDYNVF